MKQFFRNLFGLNKVVDEQKKLLTNVQELNASVERLKKAIGAFEKEFVRVTRMEDMFNEITTK